MKRFARTLATAALILAAASINAQPVRPPAVNVNAASLEQLQYLPGVGPAMAARIVAGRPYANPGSLMLVKGIKDARLKVMFHFVVTSGPTTAIAKIVTCRTNETGPQCQARVGAGREVIQYPNGTLVVEVKP